MAVFPSQAWCQELQTTINVSDSFYKAAKDYSGKSIWVINPDEGLDRPVYLFFSWDHGKLVETGEIPDRQARECDDTTTAPFSIWQRVLEGKLNPTPAIVRGQLKIEGKAIKIMRNVKVVQALFDHVLKMQAENPA